MSDLIDHDAGGTLLRIPPFPGIKVRKPLGTAAPHLPPPSIMKLRDILAQMRKFRVGGTYWAKQAPLPPGTLTLLRPTSSDQLESMLSVATQDKVENALLWLPAHLQHPEGAAPIPVVRDPCDPWHMLEHADALWCGHDDETAFIAALLGPRLRLFGEPGRFSALQGRSAAGLIAVAERELGCIAWTDPFTDSDCSIEVIVRHCSAWRAEIDANRPIAAAFGFSQWKRGTVDALLWNGSDAHAPFAPAREDRLSVVPAGAGIAVWKARVSKTFLASCEKHDGPVFEVEDGFIRSVGLGADCVPPLSIIVDPIGMHYDPSRPSTLENILAEAEFSPALLARARQLRSLIVQSRISKYEVGGAALERPRAMLRHILVPGQVEDDRSVLAGGGDVRGNLDLLRRTREAESDAYILYKPHPDVLSGHRKGDITEESALKFADAVISDQPISALLDMVDGVHVMTSLAGFEALVRGKMVTTHGVPFYSGWGLTNDLGPVPARRRRIRTLDELVAATLLLYPRYLDPVTGLPCPPETLIERLKVGVRRENRTVVMLRRAHGNLRRIISGLGFAA